MLEKCAEYEVEFEVEELHLLRPASFPKKSLTEPQSAILTHLTMEEAAMGMQTMFSEVQLSVPPGIRRMRTRRQREGLATRQ